MRVTRARLLGIVLAVTAALLVGPLPPSVAADPTSCPFAAGTFYTWTGAINDRWGQAGNWATVPLGKPPVPNDNTDGTGPSETSDTFVCIPDGATVRVSGDDGLYVDHYVVQSFFLGGGAQLDILIGASLAAMGTTESFAAPSSSITVTSGTLGGEGQIRSRGTVSVAASPNGGATLSSQAATGPPPTGQGHLVIEPEGQLLFPNLGVNLAQDYQILVHGKSRFTGSGYVAASGGSRFEVAAGTGELTFGGGGGYYQGSSPGALVNNGKVIKSGGGTSVIDAVYSQGPGAELVVESGTIAFPDGTSYTAHVDPGQRLSTEECDPSDGSSTDLDTCDLNSDPQSISLTVPAGDADGANVTVQEIQLPGGRGEAAARAGELLFDSLAHAEGLRADPRQPAIVEIRFQASRAGGAPQNRLTVFRNDGRPLKTCLGTTGEPPRGEVACVDRRPGQSRVSGGNVFLKVRTTRTSRWKVRKEAADTAAPTLYTPLKQPKGTLGNTVKVVVDKCDEKCTLSAKGAIDTKNPKLKNLALQGVTVKDVKKGKRAVLKLALTQSAMDTLARRHPTKGVAEIIVTAKDKAGNKVKQEVTVKLR